MLRTAFVAALMVAAAGRAGAQSSCPPDDTGSRALVERFFTRDAFRAARESLGYTAAVSSGQIRLLAGTADEVVCSRIAAQAGASGAQAEWRWTAYQVGGYFFVAYRHVAASGSLWMGFTPLYVLNANLAFVRAEAM
ncbi:hypothetical protein [Longimicrobium sp.]|uniref:hypothetical protein n=1 Tax=Longimicrobium sp. TaxID=2029185 RepID=UPI002CF8E01E|nr:hypothetical protein [Longimicrobium sp.]HSU15616.1 hypothetical protein [Longimicrobium sp.]